MHFMIPLLLAFMTGDEEPDERKALMQYVVVEGLVSLLLVGGAAFLLLESYPKASLGVLLLGPLIPLSGLWFYRKRHGTRWISKSPRGD